MPKMRKTLAEKIGFESIQVGIKAKTNEGLDAIGNGDAIACHAVCLLDEINK
jgi:2-C-methyl-D-erythritol 2,4-cyclodiphosphate synthase